MKIATGQIFVSLHESGRVPYGWKPVRNSTRKVKIKNVEILAALREHCPGGWKKVCVVRMEQNFTISSMVRPEKSEALR